MKNFSRLKVRVYYFDAGVRDSTVIALDGFYVNALASIGVNQKDVPSWLTAHIQACDWFNPSNPITQQVKALIMLTIVSELDGDTSPFYN